MRKQTNKILFWAGLLTLITGIVLNIFMILSQAWPTYLYFILCGIGLLQILIAKVFKNIRLLWQVFWLILPYFGLYALIESETSSYDIFLIPEDYRGQVIIEYGVKDGAVKEFEGKWRIYRIPEGGHLKTRFTIKGNSISLTDSRYFFVDKTGKRKEIKHFCNYCSEKDKDTTNIQVIYGSVGSTENKKFQDFIIDIPNSEYKKKDYSIEKTIDRINKN